MASAHHPYGLNGHPTPSARHQLLPSHQRPPCSPPTPPSPTQPRMAADSTRPHPALTATALCYWERKREGALPLPGRPSNPALRSATARTEGQKAENAERRCVELLGAAPRGLCGSCWRVLLRCGQKGCRSVLVEGAPALRIRPAPRFPICSPAALSPRPAPGAECNAASWPREGAAAMRKIIQTDPNPRSSSGSGGPSHRPR